MVSGFTTLCVGARALAGYTTLPSNPFASFADVLPGQPRSALVARGFSCPVSFFIATDPDVTDETCVFYQAIDIFRQVQVTVSQGVIRHLTFIMRENALTIGDLAALWGNPEVQEYGRSVDLFWRSHGVYAIASNISGRFSPFLPVWSVSFTDTGLLR
jgi:hypothetical protein